jgi:hypothetical protein
MQAEKIDILYVAAIIIQAAIVVFFVRRVILAMRRKKMVESAPVSFYESTRLTALHVTPQQLGLAIPSSLLKVYGVLMDWDMNGTILTLNAYITGAANVSLSSGAAVTGGGKNPAVAEQASELVLMAQSYLNRTVPASDMGYPPPGTVRFYLLTNKGLYAAQELLTSIEDESSPWVELFYKGNMVVNEIKSSGE